jgi:hypothetical protein
MTTVEPCLYKNDCTFYKKPSWTAAIKVLKEVYCNGDPSACEILTRYLHDLYIPENMMPDGTIEE